MKLGLALMVALLTLAPSVSADDKYNIDNGYLLEGGQTEVVKYTIASEKSFEAYSIGDYAEISCEIYASDRLVVQDPHVHHCFGVVAADKPTNVYFEVTNHNKERTVIYVVEK